MINRQKTMEGQTIILAPGSGSLPGMLSIIESERVTPKNTKIRNMKCKNTLFVSLLYDLVGGGVEDDHDDEDEGAL